MTEIETKKRLAEKERLKDIKKLPYQRKSKTGGKAKWAWLEDEEEPNTNSDTSKEKQNQQQETDKKEPSTLTPKQEHITHDDNDKNNKQEIMQDEQVEIIKQREQELIDQGQEFIDGVELTPEEQDKALDELLGL